MTSGFGNFIRCWRDFRRFRALPPAKRSIVFYSEGRAYGGFLRPVVEALVKNHGREVCYLTSDPDDPVLEAQQPGVETFFIGTGNARITLFQVLKAGVMVMTMPDLDNMHIKRSLHPVHYVHLLHSMVSTHMIYRTGSFDHFDSILCTGPHHLDEIRAWERLKGLPEKQLFDMGYAPLDAIIEAAARHPGPQPADSGLQVLVAPSWGPNGLLETRGAELVGVLLDAGHRVAVRPHPRTRHLTGTVLDALKAHYRDNPRFSFDENTSSYEPLLASHILISDWSGVALEYALALERPVLFIDVPRKVNNPDYESLEAVPIEVSIREEVGAVLAPDRLDQAPALVEKLCREPGAFARRARALRERSVFNVGRGSARGAEIVAELADRI